MQIRSVSCCLAAASLSLSASTFFAVKTSETHDALRHFDVRRDKPASLVGISNTNPRRAPLVVDCVFTLASDELLVAAACHKC
jgi:hypothetical protein